MGSKDNRGGGEGKKKNTGLCAENLQHPGTGVLTQFANTSIMCKEEEEEGGSTNSKTFIRKTVAHEAERNIASTVTTLKYWEKKYRLAKMGGVWVGWGGL